MHASTIGGYEIVAPLGEGGMGMVYQARGKNSTVALKVIHPKAIENPNAKKRFLREMEVVQRLYHPHIVRSIGWGQDSDSKLYFVALEYIEGENVSQLITREGAIGLDRSLEIIQAMLKALSYAHKNNLVHRDIKPENILLSWEGDIKLSDFGLVKIEEDSIAALTQDGYVLGTPYYISPEQVLNSHAVDIRSDLYSLGISLFHMLVGCPPFLNGQPVKVMMDHCYTPLPTLAEACPGLPLPVEDFFSLLTAKDRDNRYPTPEAALHALESFIQSPVLTRFFKASSGEETKMLEILPSPSGQVQPLPTHEVDISPDDQPLDRLTKTNQSPERPNFTPRQPLVLLVDDTPYMLDMIESFFSSSHPEVTLKTAASGKEALDLARDCEPTMIISDIDMPVMSGIELAQSIRGISRLHHIPIFLMTAMEGNEIQKKAYLCGADEFLRKPVSFPQLEKLYQQYLSQILFRAVLIAEPGDEAEHLRLLIQRIYPEVQLIHTTREEDAREWIPTISPQIIVADMDVVNSTGEPMYRKLADLAPDCPRLLLTRRLSHWDWSTQGNQWEVLSYPIFFDDLKRSLTSLLSPKAEPDTAILGPRDKLLSALVDHSNQNYTGVLFVQSETERGKISFDQGKIIQALCGNLKGEEAFFSLLSWPAPRFFTIDQIPQEAPNIQRSTGDLLQQAREFFREGKPQIQNNILRELFHCSLV